MSLPFTPWRGAKSSLAFDGRVVVPRVAKRRRVEVELAQLVVDFLARLLRQLGGEADVARRRAQELRVVALLELLLRHLVGRYQRLAVGGQRLVRGLHWAGARSPNQPL